jgi:outer membrane protein OmpA-like peptidoglycan-associated protein
VSNHGCPLPAPPAPEIKKAAEQINYIAHNVLFQPGKDKLTDGSFEALDQLAVILLSHPNWHLTIEGYTDNSGTPEKNLALSMDRANAVASYLISKGVDKQHVTAIGYGQEHPIADNRTEKGKAANRRVELKLSLEK